MANEVKFEVTLEEKNAIDAIKKLTANLNSFEDSAKKSFGGATKAFDVFKGVIAAQVVTKGFELIKDAAIGLFNVIANDGVKAAIAEEQALKRLDTALRLAGNSTEGASKEFLDFANALEETTGVQDDVIVGNVALLQSLAPLTKQGLKEATKAAIDLSSALGVDLESATRALGAAAQGNLSQLQRLTKQTFEQGATDVETFEKALVQLNNTFGGAATSNFQTFQGAITGTTNSFEDFIKEAGKLITENAAIQNAIRLVGDVFKDLEQFVKNNKAAISDFITNGVNFLITAFQSTVGFIRSFIASFNETGTAANTVLRIYQALAQVYINYGSIVKDILVGSFNALKTALEGVGIGANQLIGSFKVFIGFITGAFLTGIETSLAVLGKLASFFNKELGEKIKNAVQPLRQFSDAMVAEGFNQIVAIESVSNAQSKSAENFKKTEKEKQEAIKETTRQLFIANQEQGQLLSEKYLAQLEAQQLAGDQALAIRIETDQKLLDQYVANLGREEVISALSQAKKLEDEKKYTEAKKVLRDLDKKNQEAAIFSSKAFEEKTNKEKLAGLKETFGNIASLQSESSAELFAIGKAAAIANATISGIEATQKALTAAPPPFNFALAALVGVAAAANLAKIASSQPPKRQSGGLLPGVASPTDTTLFQGAPGELVLNRRQQTNLFNAINQNQVGGQSGTVVNIQGNVIADDDSQVQRLIERINDQVNFRNASLAF